MKRVLGMIVVSLILADVRVGAASPGIKGVLTLSQCLETLKKNAPAGVYKGVTPAGEPCALKIAFSGNSESRLQVVAVRYHGQGARKAAESIEGIRVHEKARSIEGTTVSLEEMCQKSDTGLNVYYDHVELGMLVLVTARRGRFILGDRGLSGFVIDEANAREQLVNGPLFGNLKRRFECIITGAGTDKDDWMDGWNNPFRDIRSSSSSSSAH